MTAPVSARSRFSRLGASLATAVVAATLLASLFASPVAAGSTVYVGAGCPNGVGNVPKLIRLFRDADQRAPSTTTIISLKDCTYTLRRAQSFPNYGPNALPIVHRHVIVRGNGATLIRGANADRFRLFGVGTTGILKLIDVTLANGAARNGKQGNGHFGGNGFNGTNGKNGGAIFNMGSVQLEHVTLADNHAGRGGAGGAGISLDAANGAVPGANGDSALNVEGGWGGNGGDGGAIYNVGTLTINNSFMQNNYAGDGGLGGDAYGGDGGNGAPGSPGGNGGAGGGATGGQGGDAGRGGAIFSSGTLTVTNTTIDANYAGNGAAVGTAVGGKGGNGADENGSGGSGGGANSWFGGTGGNGGAVYLASGVALFDNDVISNSVAGNSGGGTATGGAGGTGGCGGSGGSGGGAVSAPGPAGIGGGIANDAASLTITNTTLSGNSDGTSGASSSTGGAGGSGGPTCT